MTLYRVNYQWVAKRGDLRNAVHVVEAEDAESAIKLATDELKKKALMGLRVTSAREY